MSGIEYSRDTNPRWTRCAKALGRSFLAWEFFIWNSRCWQDFCTERGFKDSSEAMVLLGVSVAQHEFDTYQHMGVLAGRWHALPEAAQAAERPGAPQ